MSRYTGPRLRVMRALGANLPGLSAKSIEKKPAPPGEHGARRRKYSAYALRLREKQKLRFNYGLTERQMRGIVGEANRMRGNAGVLILQLLERRLDNVVFRAGFARTIPGARQLVSHGHILLNGRPCDRPAVRLDRGDTITLRPSGRALAQQAVASGAGQASPWLDVQREALTVRMVTFPDETFLPFDLEPRLIVEHYSRAM